ncbi:glucan endo-1,3-beta-glucosidase-like [Tasmannia lanceolata]|uniref:glucan endo-1,3-beta-glucosidase-like n=1 Tax=Tasmannia lanceolata TaxID=3420 RepID=UPI004064320A
MALPTGSMIGFVYGRDGNNLPPVTQTMKQYEQNHITGMWLPKPTFEVLDALSNTQIKVTICIANSDLRSLATNPATANSWVKKYILDYWPTIKYQYICVGNEALATRDSDHLLPAMMNIFSAIQAKPNTMNKIKVSTTLGIADLEAYDPTSPPSTCTFNENITANLSPILSFLSENETPLFVNIFPHSVRVKNPQQPDLSHYLFTATDPLVTDGDYEYNYVLDSVVDGFYYAMEAMNVRDVKIIVGATGWPRSGGQDASSINAQTYNSNLVKHVLKGTPKWPRRLETYISSMYDENLKRGNAWEKNYGVYGKDGKPLYTFP